MRVHWLQHAPEDDLGCIAPWLAAQGVELRHTALFRNEPLPARVEADCVIAMGGPMNINEHEAYPWLVDEKRYLSAALQGGARVLGICLGAQLIADRLGGPTTKAPQQELGWFPVRLTDAGRRSRLLQDWPDEVLALHWHRDTYALPLGAIGLASSQACPQQAFEAEGGRVVGLQFHPEVTAAGVRRWLADETIEPGPYVQTREAILADLARFGAINRLLIRLLERFLA